jgi:type II secretion system protein H
VRQAGVTLLELLIVIALMGIVAALVVPMFGGPVSTSELRATARQLAAGLRLARSEAVSERRETFLVVDVAGKRFKVDREAREQRRLAFSRMVSESSETRDDRAAGASRARS